MLMNVLAFVCSGTGATDSLSHKVGFGYQTYENKCCYLLSHLPTSY